MGVKHENRNLQLIRLDCEAIPTLGVRNLTGESVDLTDLII